MRSTILWADGEPSIVYRNQPWSDGSPSPLYAYCPKVSYSGAAISVQPIYLQQQHSIKIGIYQSPIQVDSISVLSSGMFMPGEIIEPPAPVEYQPKDVSYWSGRYSRGDSRRDKLIYKDLIRAHSKMRR